ncbi:YqeG family HAD IIIA-type phosphatase [Zongyangia hominis]|nr:YqeG family HAD IIIA-type phosphatase [Zongyangia hominis]
MALIRPTIMLDNITQIDGPFLRRHQIGALMLDVDNTLSLHGNPEPYEGIAAWVKRMRDIGVEMIIVSNNSRERVQPFADKLGIPCVGGGYKPLSKGMREAQAMLKTPKRHCAIVGDQLFTDIMGGNLYGITSILVTPYQLEDKTGFKIKRGLERGFLRRYRRAQNKNGGGGR